MFWPWEVAERDHEIQNPVNPEKIRLLGEYLRPHKREPRPRARRSSSVARSERVPSRMGAA
jgi:hypothetical protein